MKDNKEVNGRYFNSALYCNQEKGRQRLFELEQNECVFRIKDVWMKHRQLSGQLVERTEIGNGGKYAAVLVTVLSFATNLFTKRGRKHIQYGGSSERPTGFCWDKVLNAESRF